jgi:alkylation response protein AidB-like acyl-CoA dehydrogenase
MDFNFTEEQTLLENMVTSFVRDNYPWEAREAIVKTEEGWKPENWNQFAELGLLGVPFAEEFGGLGGSVVDTMIVMEQFGKGLVVEPYMPSVVLAGGLISSLGSKEQVEAIIPTIISGEARYAFAHSEPQSRFYLFYVKNYSVGSGVDFVVNFF